MTHTKKSLGQHWLHDNAALEAICESADVGQGDLVLEIGPGTGTLTGKLLQKGAEVWAIEFDQSLIQPLQDKFKGFDSSKFWVEHGDIRTYDFGKPASDYKVVANIPYYLTSHLIRSISESYNPPAMAVLLVQKEVAERVAANPGNMSLLSITAQFYWEVSLDRVVPAELFTPPPKVDSQILILKRRKTLLFPDVEPKQFFRLIKAGFSARRKTLLNSLSGGLRIDKTKAGELLEAAGIDPQLRPQSLALPRWHELYQAAQKLGIF